ncbi:MAG: ribbon-helix-helix protein, CopG family [Thermodesulfobacteriota bacterium]|nr:ribbon-helix-helix protein, CopG family [Thermodesulfobacteriota bacterium]
MRTVLSLSLPENMAKELNDLAGEMGRTKSDIVKDSLSRYLWEMKLRKAQNLLYPKAKASGIVTEEDMLREIS